MWRLIVVSISLVFIGAGCTDDGRGLVPVSGRVTFAGGPPPTNGSITFTPISVQEGHPQRPGTAQFDKDGFFKVTSYKKDDGLVPGTYHPNVSCWKAPPDSRDPGSFERLNYVPKDFKPDPIQVDAGAGEVEVAIDVPRKPE